ncbi:hypothetical protein [Spirosoma oryzicola]|uniref:hypothetical protein n=1 Tax=Spirosoma oryzicola TaxID=2898794 RepID=UPI001E3B7025|nr:hypothetical protein [Spirosoma oryzicola]UHG90523.1 hypothetical protein LQ777_20015 [Spirosoma oryzicola]
MKSYLLSLSLLVMSGFTATAQNATRFAQPAASTKATTTNTSPAAQPVAQNAPVSPQKTVPTPGAAVRTTPLQSSSERPLYINAGIGLGAYTAGGIPIGLSVEKTIQNNISVGGSIDYARYGYNTGGYSWHYTFIYAGARGSYHLGELLNTGNDKFDPYAGVSLGFRHASYKDTYGYVGDYYNPYSSGLYLGIHLGARYMFSEKFGGFAEVGYGVSALRLGLSAKF